MKTPEEKLLEYSKLFTKKTIPQKREDVELRLKILLLSKSKPKAKQTRKSVADAVFSIYIRLKHSYMSAGERLCNCVTCGLRYKRREIQAGHYRSRMCLKYRFDENQVYPQCYTCNVIRNGYYRNYKIFMDKTVGPEMEEIYRTDKELVKYNIAWYQTRILEWYSFITKTLTKDEMKENGF